MRVWTKSACAVLAWGLLLIIVAAAGMSRSVRPAQANIRIASSTTEVTVASTLSVAAASVAAASPAARYVVQPGDTLSGIAARLAVRGGWPALYAANRHRIGPDPDLIRPGTILVLPGRMALARYTVAAGDTLAGIAAALAVRGGWPALYAANRHRIGPDPDLIRPGTVLAIPRPASPSAPASSPGRRVPPAPPSAPAGSRHRPPPATAPAAGMPGWLKTVLLAAGLVIGAGFLAGPAVLLIRRRRRLAAKKARVVLAGHDRVVVAYSPGDGTACVLRPPGADPEAILRAARLVLPEDLYRELAGLLGVPASWPIILAGPGRVLAYSTGDDTVYVVRPPGEDPGAILRAARPVLPEDLYRELAEQLGMPASWPMEAEVPAEAGGGRTSLPPPGLPG